MKKSLKLVLSLILIFLLAIVITGCSNKNIVENNTVENKTVVSTPETIDENNIDEEGLEVEGFIESNPDMISGATIDEEDKFVVGAVNQTPVYYSQIDSRWKNHPYTAIGKASQTIGTSGCGPTCSAMVVLLL